jgi:U3 small nucleolar RNA-associated protein 12
MEDYICTPIEHYTLTLIVFLSQKLQKSSRSCITLRQERKDGQIIPVSRAYLTPKYIHTKTNCSRKYEHSKTFGVINSNTSNVVWSAHQQSSSNTGAGRAITAANEEVLCWDIKKGELLGRWIDNNCKAQVTAIAQSKTDPDVFAVGYEDGSIRLWDSKIATIIVSFNGHKSAVTCFSFDDSGARLASGSKDTDIIIWDLVAEVGLFKLRGHKDQITGLSFVTLSPSETIDETGEAVVGDNINNSGDFLMTTGKDSLIKLWDVSSRHCIETHVTQTNGECWALGISPDGSGCITAGNDGELEVSISHDSSYGIIIIS